MKKRKCMADGGVLEQASGRVRQAAKGIADFRNIGKPAETTVMPPGRRGASNDQQIVQADTRPDLPQERNPRRFAEAVDQRKQARSGGYADGGIIPVDIRSGLMDAVVRPIADDWAQGNKAIRSIRNRYPTIDAAVGLHPVVAASQLANDVMSNDIGVDSGMNVLQAVPIVKRLSGLEKLLSKQSGPVVGGTKFVVDVPSTVRKNVVLTGAQATGQPGEAFARGGIIPVRGKGTGTSDSIPAVLAGHEVRVSNGEGVAVLPAKTMRTPGAVAAVEDVIEQTNGKPPAPMADGGKYADGALPEEAKTGSRFLSGLPEGGILRTQQGRQQAAQAIANAPAIGAPLTIGGGQPVPTAPSIYAPAYAAARQGLSGEGLRPEVGITGPRAVPQKQAEQQVGNYDPSRLSTGVIRRPEAQPGIPPATSPAPYSNEGRRSAIGSVNASPAAAAATPAGGPTAAEAARQPQFPKPSEPVPSGTGFIRNNRTGAVTPVGKPLAESLAPQPVATPARLGVLEAVQPAAQPTDTNRYRQTAEKILLDESRGPGGGVAARLLMGLAGRAAGMDNDAARTLNETQEVATRAQQAAAELASTDHYRRASLGIQDREQSMREQESADKLQDTAAQRAARAGIADAIESGDEAKIKKAHAKGIAAGVLKSTDERKHEESPYRIHTDTTSGDQVRINQKTGATDRLDRATNTWQPVGASQPKQAPQAAIDALRANPALAAQFQQKYGYLPQ